MSTSTPIGVGRVKDPALKPMSRPHSQPNRLALLLFLGLALLPVACGPLKSDAQSPALAVAELRVGNQTLQAEIADTPESMERGLMFRDHLPDSQAMLFVFAAPQQVSFWMRNTSIPLDVAYLDRDGRILEIHQMFPFDESSITSHSDRVAYALETNQNWFEKRHISIGTPISGLKK